MHLTNATATDHPSILAINQANLPAVSSLRHDDVAALASMALRLRVARDDDGVCGFMLLLGPHAPYGSVNYAWFTARYADFVYVDRIAIAASGQRQGLGRALYDEAQALATARRVPLLAEVNIRPRNDMSLAFHEAMGFAAVGEQDTDEGAKRVVKLAWSPS